MECLRDYIGLTGCGSASPESGFYVNSLPGISLESIDKLAKSEQVTYAGVWNDVQTRALKKFEGVITTLFAKRFRKKSLRQSLNLGKIIDATTASNQTAAIAQFNGFSAETNFKSVPVLTVSNLQGISFQSLSLYLKAVPANPFEVSIWDMDSGERLWTKTLNNASNPVTTGWNNITVNEVFYSACRLFAGYDATQINSPLLNIDVAYLSSSFGACCSQVCLGGCEAFIRGAQTVTSSDPTLLTYGSNSYGLTGVFSVVCSFEPLVCNNKRLFDDSLWYFMGAEMMIERLYSPRWNFWTLEREEAQRLYNLFLAEGNSSLELAIDGIDLDLNDACIECNEQVRIIESTP